MMNSRLSLPIARRIFQKNYEGMALNNMRTFASESSRKYLVINAIGLDRPGIVSEVSEIITNHEGNVGESRAMKLGDHFSMMMLADVPEHQSSSLKVTLSSISGLYASSFDTAKTRSGVVRVAPTIGYEGILSLSGADNTGILHKVAGILSNYRLNIDNLETNDEEAPFGGTTLFRMTCNLQAIEPIADKFDISAVRKELAKLGNELNCDIHIDDINDESDQVSSM